MTWPGSWRRTCGSSRRRSRHRCCASTTCSAIADDPEVGRRAVLALEGIEHADDQLGTVVMGAVAGRGGLATEPTTSGQRRSRRGRTPGRSARVSLGGLLGAIVGAVVVGGAALLFGAEGWELVGAAAAGAMLFAVFGAIWLTFAGFGGSDAYRQTFVDDTASELTIVSVHTDDPDEAAAARSGWGTTDVTGRRPSIASVRSSTTRRRARTRSRAPRSRVGRRCARGRRQASRRGRTRGGRGRAARGRHRPDRSPRPTGSCRGTDGCRPARRASVSATGE